MFAHYCFQGLFDHPSTGHQIKGVFSQRATTSNKPYVVPRLPKSLNFNCSHLKTSENFGKNRQYVLFLNGNYIHRRYHVHSMYTLSCEKPAKDSIRMIGSEIMSQPIKISIDYCFTQSCKQSLLLISHMLTYIQPTFCYSECIRPMKFFVHIDILVE